MPDSAVPAPDSELLHRIAQAAEQAVLGRHRAVYPAAPSNWAALGKMFSVLLGTVALTAIGVVAGLEWLQALAGFVSFVLILGVPITAWRTWRYDVKVAGSRLDLFENGMVAALPSAVCAFRYDTAEVLQNITRHYRNGVYQGTTYHYTFSAPDGTRAVLNEAFANVTQWGPAIQEAVTAAQLPTAAAKVRAGHRVTFGDLWITATEVGSTRKSAPWDRVQNLDLTRGHAAIAIEGKLFDLTVTPISRIPNFFVFHALFDHLRATHGRISVTD